MFGRLAHEIIEAAEKGLVPAAQIEAVAAVDVAWRGASRPGTNKPAVLGSQRVAFDIEGAGRFDICPRKRARQVQPVLGEGVEIFLVIEIKIEDGAVMLA